MTHRGKEISFMACIGIKLGHFFFKFKMYAFFFYTDIYVPRAYLVSVDTRKGAGGSDPQELEFMDGCESSCGSSARATSSLNY